jgi:hypothetical protein
MAEGSDVVQDPPSEQPIPLLWVLTRLGDKHDIYFTIESGYTAGEPVNRLESILIRESSLAGSDIQQKLSAIRKEAPDFTYEIVSGNPRIIHIIDSRLASLKSYGLLSTVKRLDFSGRVDELITFLSKQNIPVTLQNFGDIREMREWDMKTLVKVKADGLRVRDVLSNFIPLNRSGRILWIARTKLEQGAVSQVQFRGRAITK